MTKPESIIWIFIICLLIMFTGYLGYFLYLILTNKEGYQDKPNYNRLKGITNFCLPYELNYKSPECVDISFSDYDNSVYSVKAILDPGYGVDPKTGFVISLTNDDSFNVPIDTKTNYSSQKNLHENIIIKNKPTLGNYTPTVDNKTSSKNDRDNIDIQYHADPSTLANAKDDLIGYGLVKNEKGEVVPIPYSELKGQTLYNQPGTSRFGPSSYVPNYEETVFLSKLTNEIPFLPIKKQTNSLGFCKENANSLNKIESKCGTLDNETCASTECCVLFGGVKCVAGDDSGPSIQSNYSDFLIKNRDYYYYKGKCYGNCSRSYGIKNTTGYGTNNLYATYSPNVNIQTTSVPTRTPSKTP